MTCPNCGDAFEELDPRLFSFNSPHGWCPVCNGFGYILPFTTDDEKAEFGWSRLRYNTSNSGYYYGGGR